MDGPQERKSYARARGYTILGPIVNAKVAVRMTRLELVCIDIVVTGTPYGSS